MKYNIKLINQKIEEDITEIRELITKQQFSLMSIKDRVQYRLNKKEYGE